MKTLLLFLLMLTASTLSAQNLETDTLIYDIVEKAAIPENGYHYLYEHLKRNLYLKKIEKKRLGVDSKFRFEIIVNMDGSCELKKITPDTWDLKSIQHIKWIPAEAKGRKVRQRIIIPMIIC